MKRIVNTRNEKLDLKRTYPSFPEEVFGLKPNGLWYGINEAWIDWCRSEMPEWIRQHNHEIKVDTSKLLVISSIEELNDFIRQYSRKTESSVIDCMQWNKVKETFMGIEVHNYRHIKWNLDYDMKNIWFSSWDVSSGCIWDLKAVKSVCAYQPKKTFQLHSV